MRLCKSSALSGYNKENHSVMLPILVVTFQADASPLCHPFPV